MTNRSLLWYRGALGLLTSALLLLSAVHYRTRQEAADFLIEREDMRLRIQVLEQENGALNAETEDLTKHIERLRQVGKPTRVHTFETAEPVQQVIKEAK